MDLKTCAFQYWLDDYYNTEEFIVVNHNSFETIDCKEELIREVVESGINEFYWMMSDKRMDSTIAKLEQWQKKRQFPATFERYHEGILIVKYPKWWLNYYRMNWLAMAVRVASDYEDLDSDSGDLEKKFNAFINGATKEPKGVKMTYNQGFRYYWEN